MFPNALRIRSLHGLGSLLQDFKVQYAAFYEDCENLFSLGLCVASTPSPQEHNSEENPQKL